MIATPRLDLLSFRILKNPIFLALLALAFLSPATQAGKIDWSPATGYQSSETDLSGLTPEELSRILEWMNEGRKAEEKGRYRAAVRRYKKVSKRYPKSQYSPEAYFRRAQIALERNKPDKAFEAFSTIAWSYPNYGSFNEVIGQMYKIAVYRLETYRDKILWVIPAWKNTDRAMGYFERIVAVAPYSDYAPLSLMNIAKGWDRKNSDIMTVYALDRLTINYPGSFLTPDAYLQLAETHYSMIRGPDYDMTSTEDAITFFEDFLIKYPENERVDVAEIGLSDSRDMLARSKLTMGDFYNYKRKMYDAAKILYNEAITIAPLSGSAAKARERIEKIDVIVADSGGAIGEPDPKAPTAEQLEEKARKRAKRKVLGIF